MTGSMLLGVVLVSMAWLVFGLGAAANFQSWRLTLRARYRDEAPSATPFIPGVAGSLAAFFTIPGLVQFGIDVPWPWLWILLPLFLDVGTLGGVALALFGLRRHTPLESRPTERDDEPAIASGEAVRADPRRVDAAVGCLLGTAVADALGLAVEGLSKRRLQRWQPDADIYHLLPFGRGMCSDDTEHSCMLAQAVLVSSGHHPEWFARELAMRLRGWLLGLPAGIGYATLRAILKLWLFLPRRYWGVYSAGNGPAMRVALLGVLFGDEPELLRELVSIATRITHTDPKAECGALAVALAAHESMQDAPDFAHYMTRLRDELDRFGAPGAELIAYVEQAQASAAAGEETETFADLLGLGRGVSGYMYHTVPVALHGWMRHPRDYAAAVRGVIRCGGDTDTVAAVTGAIVGAGTGKAGIPARWLAQLAEWPRTVAWMEQLAARAARSAANEPGFGAQEMPLSLLALGVRNAAFMLIVLAHGFRRLLPPY